MIKLVKIGPQWAGAPSKMPRRIRKEVWLGHRGLELPLVTRIRKNTPSPLFKDELGEGYLCSKNKTRDCTDLFDMQQNIQQNKKEYEICINF